MPIRLLFFGATADLTKVREIDLELEAGDSSNNVLARAIEKFPQLNGHKLLLSINQSYAVGDELVRHGDEIAIFTAVSGG